MGGIHQQVAGIILDHAFVIIVLGRSAFVGEGDYLQQRHIYIGICYSSSERPGIRVLSFDVLGFHSVIKVKD
ncbi:hypothetical protein D3C87_2103130 [compost metagenome]